MVKEEDILLTLSYDDVLLVPKYSEIDSRSEVDLRTKITRQIELEIPLISTKMDSVTGVEMAVAMGKLGGLGILPRFERAESQARKVARVKKQGLLAAAAVGCKDGFLERAEMLVKAGARIINIDVAHGHMKKNIEATRRLKQKFGGKVVVLSGIVATREAAEDLYKAGADSLLVGIGAGSICTTRIQTGCGVPGFSSLLSVAPVARKYKKTFIPDAGIRNSGDIVKALAAGASAIVAGSLFAGTDETPGRVIMVGGKPFKRYNGSASEEEKKNQKSKLPKGKNKMYEKHIEGVEALVPYKGSVEELIVRLLAGVRSGLSYCGAKDIKQLWEKAEFVRVTSGGLKESGPHDVLI